MKRILLGLISILLFFALVIGWPILYNYHIFSLAQLKNSINIGDQYELIERKFNEYEVNHSNVRDLQVVINSNYLFIYHVNIFDDCQLSVTFDSNGKVNDVSYIGD